MTLPAQKNEERKHIEEFFRLEGLTASTFEQPEVPDAVITIEGHRVGIEHCELTQEELAGNRDNLQAIASIATEALRRAGLRFKVSLGVSDAGAPEFRKRRTVENIARKLAELVHTHGVMAPVRELQTLSREVLSIVVRPREAAEVIVQAVVRAGGRAAVCRAVAAKERKLPRYRSVVDEVWLLLVTGKTWTEPTELMHIRGMEVASAFDAVYLLDLQAHSVMRLKPIGLPPAAR